MIIKIYLKFFFMVIISVYASVDNNAVIVYINNAVLDPLVSHSCMVVNQCSKTMLSLKWI